MISATASSFNLLKQGENLGRIEFFLEHKKMKIAEIIQGIKSPLDRLNIENESQNEKSYLELLRTQKFAITPNFQYL